MFSSWKVIACICIFVHLQPLLGL
uniref:Uncharacterized protein n=1 Tax=Anguilla anguilla TaxID=7936 RepID=A0A0E9VGL1_ANGAN